MDKAPDSEKWRESCIRSVVYFIAKLWAALEYSGSPWMVSSRDQSCLNFFRNYRSISILTDSIEYQTVQDYLSALRYKIVIDTFGGAGAAGFQA